MIQRAAIGWEIPELLPLIQSTAPVAFYEHRTQPLLPQRRFIRRILIHAALVLAFVSLSIALGVLGFRYYGELAWLDALLNAAMILGGMGLVADLDTSAGKLFASLYALYAGLAFLTMAAVLIAPFVHRFLHGLHLEATPDEA